MCRQTVGPKCRFGFKFRVSQPNLELRWRFRNIKGKMTFMIYRQKLQKYCKDPDEDYGISFPKICSKKTDGISLELQNMMEDTLRNDFFCTFLNYQLFLQGNFNILTNL